MSKPEIKKFLDKIEGLQKSPSAVDEFRVILKHETLRQVKDQLATELTPLRNYLANVEAQNAVIIRLLKNKLDFDVQEKEILDLLRIVLEKES